VLDSLSSHQETHQEIHEVRHDSVSQSELSECLRVEKEPDEPSSLPMRPAAQVQMSLLRLPMQDQGPRTKTHSAQASEL